MTNREYEEIIRAAFGESEPGDDTSLSQAGSKAASDEFVRLRAGLKSLADIPECQLSREHLRNAILSGGVKRKTSNWWFVGPIAIGAAAMFGFVLLFAPKPAAQQTGSPTVALQSSTEEGHKDLVASINVPSSSKAAADSAASVLDLAKSKSLMAMNMPEPTVERHKPVRRVQRVAKSTADTAAMAPPTAKAMIEPGAASGGMESVATPGMGGAAADMAAPSPSVIVVEPGSDPVTRAQPAQEVKRGDVLFGG